MKCLVGLSVRVGAVSERRASDLAHIIPFIWLLGWVGEHAMDF